MMLTKPKNDFDYEAGDLQYARPQGTLEQQQATFTKGGFRWLSAPEVRRLIVDNLDNPNPDLANLGREWHRTGTGVEYVNAGKVMLYLMPQSRVLSGTQAFFDEANSQIRNVGIYGITKSQANDLESMAKEPSSEILVVDHDVLARNNAFVRDNETSGHLVLSTKNYRRQMNDDPNIANLVKAGYGQGDTLDRIMADLRAKGNKETWAWTLTPNYIKRIAKEGTGVGRLSAVNGYCNDGGFDASRGNIGGNDAFAFGVRHKSAEGGHAEKK